MLFSCPSTHQTHFFLEELLQTNAVCTFSGAFHPSAGSWAEHRQQITHSKPCTAALRGWWRALNVSPTRAQLCCCWHSSAQSSLLWMQPVPASLGTPQKPCRDSNGKLSPISYGIAQGHHLDSKGWAWLKWKDSSEASTYWNGSFVMSQCQNHKCFPQHTRAGVTELWNIPTQQLVELHWNSGS